MRSNESELPLLPVLPSWHQMFPDVPAKHYGDMCFDVNCTTHQGRPQPTSQPSRLDFEAAANLDKLLPLK